MIIAVSGATGSLGRELTKFFESQGHEVLRISSSAYPDNKSTFSFNNLKMNKIDMQVDIFFHLASLNTNVSEQNIEEEVLLTKTVLAGLVKLKCENLVFFSSAKVYGDNSFDDIIFHEYSPLNPKCAYGKSKKICEELIHSYARDHKLNFLIFRLPPVLNPSSNSNVNKIFSLNQKIIPLVSFAKGNKNRRSFLSLPNLKTILDAILNKQEFIKSNTTFNLADDGYISFNNLLRGKSRKNIFLLPSILFLTLQNVSIIRQILLKLYGNFQISNSRVKVAIGVKLMSTFKLLPKIEK